MSFCHPILLSSISFSPSWPSLQRNLTYGYIWKLICLKPNEISFWKPSKFSNTYYFISIVYINTCRGGERERDCLIGYMDWLIAQFWIHDTHALCLFQKTVEIQCPKHFSALIRLCRLAQPRSWGTNLRFLGSSEQHFNNERVQNER